MNLSNIVSIADQELLQELHELMSNQEIKIGAEFDEELRSSGLLEMEELTNFFLALLLGDGDRLVRTSFEKTGWLDIRKIVSLFDNYLTCLSRRSATLIPDANRARRTSDAIRKLAFHYLVLALEGFADAPQAKQDASLIDQSTGMLNQEGFELSLNYLLDRDPDGTIALLVIELDGQSNSADAIAHMQQEISGRIMQVAREGDLIAQILPTRWVLGLYRIQSEAHANLAALKIKRLFEKPIVFSEGSARLKTRIGIAMSPDHGRRAEQLLQSAWAAARWASQNIEGIQFYSHMGAEEGARLDSLVSKLRKTLFENLLELYYQPQFSIKNKSVVGVEALLRWPLSDRNVPPPLIIEIIESENIVPQFTQWLLHTAFRNFSEFRQRGINTTLSINLLPQNFSQPELAEIVSQAIEVWKVPADQIILELTEGSLLRDMDATIQQIERLKEIGVRVSMDDFGTGYSSMSYLSRLDIDELKIDQSFTRSMLTSSRDMAIVQAIINLADNFELELVAEGVESADMARILYALGCDIIQGYWISRPLSPENLIHFLETDFRADINLLELKTSIE